MPAITNHISADPIANNLLVAIKPSIPANTNPIIERIIAPTGLVIAINGNNIYIKAAMKYPVYPNMSKLDGFRLWYLLVTNSPSFSSFDSTVTFPKTTGTSQTRTPEDAVIESEQGDEFP